MLKKLNKFGFASLIVIVSGINFHTECKVLPNASYKIEEGITSFGTVPHDSLWTAYYTSSGDLITKVSSTSKEQYELDPNAPKPQVTAFAIKYWDKNFTYTWTKRPWQTTPLTFGEPENYYIVLYDKHGNRITMRPYFPRTDVVLSIINGYNKWLCRTIFFCALATGREEVELHIRLDHVQDYCSIRDLYLRDLKEDQRGMDEEEFAKLVDAYATLAEDFLTIPKYYINNKDVRPSYYEAFIDHIKASDSQAPSFNPLKAAKTGAELKWIISQVKEECHLDDLCVEEEFSKTQKLIDQACKDFHSRLRK